VTLPALDTTGMADARSLYREARRYYAPKAAKGVTAWAESERVLSVEGSAEPGRYSLARTPWWRDVLAQMADETTEELVVAKSSQVGYTELLNTFIGWCMAEDPSSLLMIQPTVEMAEAWSKERLAPMLRDTPALHGILRTETKGMARSSDDTLRRKAFPGGWLAILGANSPASLASRPVRRVIGDERDRWPVSAGSEGDPLELARRRTITYWNRKIIEGGTPTEEGASPTWSKWEASTQNRWHVPCPHCGEFQPLVWRSDAGDAAHYRIVCERDPDGHLLPETAYYECVSGCVIEEKDKARMVSAGKWVPAYPGRRVQGYHIWAGYSPWMTWAEIVREFEAARGAEALLRVFVNTIVGEPFAPAAEKIDPSKLMARAEQWETPPAECGILTAGVDVQADRVEYVVTGWGESERACVLEYGIVEGDPGQDSTWDELTAELSKPRGDLRVYAVAADTGYRPETVWRWGDRRLPFRVFSIKGQEGRGRPIMQKPGAVTHKRKRRPWLVGVDTAKDSLAARLRSTPDGPQGVRFSDGLPPEFYDHLTAEKLVTEFIAKRPVRRWRLIDGRRNEGLDCTVYALAALHGCGVQTVAKLGALAQSRAEKRQAASPSVQQQTERGQVQAPRRSSNRTPWVRRY
jgi:phage terminase large subunit GpA-like protein